jgi:hypothetical protein
MNMRIATGTMDTRTEHSTELGALGLMISMGVPAAIAIGGIVALGWGAISWAGAIVWGILAAIAMTLFMMMGHSMGMTRMDLFDLLGSMVAPAHTSRSRGIGAMIHLMDGALLAIAWAFAAALVGWAANWASGLVWGVILALLALLMMSSIGAVHPAIRRAEEEDPGAAATNFGKMTPMGILVAHLIYGAVLGLLYQAWPL